MQIPLVLDMIQVSLSVGICPDAVNCQISVGHDRLLCLPLTAPTFNNG